MVGRAGIMSKAFWRSTLAACAVALLLPSVTVAQDTKAPPAGANPVGSWGNAKVTSETGVTSITLDPKQIEVVKAISGYFNEWQNLKGSFLQTDADKQRLRGRFFVKRPGRLRFEYSLPSRQLIIADGQNLAVQDLDIKTDDRIALDQTTFRLLLKNDVDLIRDARILEVQDSPDLVIVSLQDKSSEAPGKIRLFLTRSPALELKEWVMTDAQGRDTRVEIANLVKTEEIDPALFKIVNPGLKANQN